MLFFVGHAAIYTSSARMFGSFGGDAIQALSVVAPTVAGSAAFGNLSGVHLYATAISAYPLFIGAMLQLTKAEPGIFGRLLSGPYRIWIRSAFFVAFFLLLVWMISGLATLLSLIPTCA